MRPEQSSGPSPGKPKGSAGAHGIDARQYRMAQVRHGVWWRSLSRLDLWLLKLGQPRLERRATSLQAGHAIGERRPDLRMSCVERAALHHAGVGARRRRDHHRDLDRDVGEPRQRGACGDQLLRAAGHGQHRLDAAIALDIGRQCLHARPVLLRGKNCTSSAPARTEPLRGNANVSCTEGLRISRPGSDIGLPSTSAIIRHYVKAVLFAKFLIFAHAAPAILWLV